MKIEQSMLSKLTNNRETKSVVTGEKSFSTYVHKQGEKMQAGHLQQLMKEIEGQGERLARGKNFRDLAKFKHLVKKFVQEAVDYGMNVKQSTSWDMHGFQQTHRTVAKVDEQLVELTERVMEKESDSLTVLEKIGEIKGLLINLYT
ncbi:YaaR family protein [Priestia taiwanensis]|uniref:DUF327 domain-containing protein n=1 Tax=Priestia taiwanensis TaxID=1347902 RepID=A0A917AZ82_9BACI|nr:YaaR family protein [Priestia taiwanensis]MBM7365200.1 uncharacterized protein YaaR (DUF327 family) [Priestia taiwanensis]GGE84487.1 hypothetical protein GCM10007140_37500 [Priestia taiwanensis]